MRSTWVILYDGQTHSIFSRFTDVAYSGSLRHDGKVLLVAAGETGIIKVLDAGSRFVWRQLKGHSSALHFTRYVEGKVHVFSAGDYNTARWWDAPSEESLLRLRGHTDYVRRVRQVVQPRMYGNWLVRSHRSATGYKKWQVCDAAAARAPSRGWCFLSIWWASCLSRCNLPEHQKAIASVQVSWPPAVVTQSTVIGGEGPQLTFLDGHIKVHELYLLKSTHSSRYPALILWMAVSPTLQALAVRLSSGL
ncbi:hypothetical protein CBR_g31026 [Chara braunii]|uniref:Bulb-type lectin domain-containing protein n=1 Tax=Chara braunii TaxID=69332 RepID=A0A388LE30_CHABU|nr:hypothetical protein CBR_g31026 [Chara braunii]|eukprot:GBG80566.1 hypothetical protein CBR_g31026 [Chara braunii]